MTVFFGLKFRLRNIILSRLTTSSCSCMISRTGEGVSRIQLVGECIVVGKFSPLQPPPHLASPVGEGQLPLAI